MKGLYLVTGRSDGAYSSYRRLIKKVKEAVDAGVDIVQYREKNTERRMDAWETLQEIRKITDDANIPLIVNDCIACAQYVGAEGVHLGQNDAHMGIARDMLGKDAIIGKTVHSAGQAIQAEAQGADYVGLGPIYPSKSKSYDFEALGLDMIKEVKGSVSIPVVAIGGIEYETIDEVLEAGADSIAMISAILESDDVFNTVKKFKKKFSKD